MPNWNPLNNKSKYGVMDTMSSVIAKIERNERDFLPDLRADSDLALVSDYAGEHRQVRFDVLSYLLADRPGILRTWDDERRAIRLKYLRDGRRIEFKSLGDRNKQKALGSFLSSASSINGVLFCVAIEKTIKSISYPGLPSPADITKWSQLRWSPKVFEKLVRVFHFGSFLVAGLCRPGQNLIWITDDDEIVPNEDFQKDACRIADRMLIHYYSQPMGQITLGIAGKFEDERRAEDLVSIVDIVAGCVSEMLSAISPEDFPKSSKIVSPILRRISTKSQLIWVWLSGLRGPLKKMICVWRTSASGKLQVFFLNPQNLTGLTGRLPLWLPPDRGWKQSSESW